MASKRFDKRVNFLLTEGEYAMLDAVAKREGLSASDMVRQLIRRQHAAVFGEQPVTKPSKARKRSK